MSCKKTDDLKSIVIVGGGGVGLHLARALSPKINSATHHIILINPRPYRINLPATLRLETAFIPFDKLFVNGNGTFIEPSVTSVQKSDSKGGSVTLDNGESVAFEYLVLASRSIFEGPLNFPNKKEDVLLFVNGIRQQIEGANDIVFAGGGSVGLDIYPNKNITIVQGSDHLLNDTYPLKFRTYAEKNVKKRSIKVVLGDFTSIKTRSGKSITADTVFQTRGGRPHTEFIKSLGPDLLTDGGQVKFRPTLQLASYDNIFAGGDILDIKEEKQVAKALGHVQILTANILASISNKPLKPYNGSTEMILITNGSDSY
ncbi:FAD/NAD-P-binding domain-containing protein [Pleurotus eryngii]|uniref:FAD/NAD-P-binding domain-containing protein n=1 Tax=Pleurotus eryngii TaxID=5323 RepID=A0A9P6A902_PLEER|nr:FAD/NAD-P-binding domain-containing protein [Pleurotus eryngii]